MYALSECFLVVSLCLFFFIIIIIPSNLNTLSPDVNRYRSQYFPIRQPRGFSAAYGNGLWKWSRKRFVCVCLLPGTSVAAGWSLSGWRPEAAGCWATGRAARHLSEPVPGHTPGTTHTHTKLDWGTKTGCVFVCRCVSFCDTVDLPVRTPMWPGGYQEELDIRSTTPHTVATTPSLFSKEKKRKDR